MSIYKQLMGRIEYSGESSFVQLQELFDWFVSLDLQYETASNIVASTIVRPSSAIVDSIRDGRGAHCIEHAQLFKDMLVECGFDARLVNASHKDYITRTSSENSMTYTLVECEKKRYLCDTFYSQCLLEVPEIGGSLQGSFYTRRLDADHFSFAALAQGKLVAEDTVDERSAPEERLATINQRFPDFMPFGVFVPFFQTVRPYRRALFYTPKFDRFTAQEGGKSHSLRLDELHECFWIPASIRMVIESALEVNRAQREKSMAALRFGITNPNYQQLKY